MGEITADQSKRLISYDTSRKLKSLNTTRSKLLSYRKKCRITITQAEADIKDTDERIAEIDLQLLNLDRDNPIVVSEHALLRYLSRHKGIDLDEVANEIASLPENEVIRRGNSIVTILEDPPQT